MGKLILIRHGQSIWNKENRFTGWIDVSLSKKGLFEAKKAAIKLKNIKFNTAFTSNLIRAQETLFEILNKNNLSNKYIKIHENESKWYSHQTKTNKDNDLLKVFSSEKLNERYYGDLQGLNKDETIKKFGEKLVHIWRRSFNIAPPNGNSLEETYKNTIPYFKSNIEPLLKKNECIIIAAHGNSLRSIMKYIENISDEDISKLELKTAIPYSYTFDKNMKIKQKIIL